MVAFGFVSSRIQPNFYFLVRKKWEVKVSSEINGKQNLVIYEEPERSIMKRKNCLNAKNGCHKKLPK